MSLQDLLGGMFGGQQPENPMTAMASATDEDAAPAPAQPGGLSAAINQRPDLLGLLSHSLAGGMAGVKNSPFAGQSFANALGGSLTGGNTYEDKLRDLAIAEREKAATRGVTMRGQDLTHEVGMKNSDTSRFSAESNDTYRKGLLDQGNFQFSEGTQPDAEGKPVPGVFKLDRKAGTMEFVPGATLPKVGRGGAGSSATERLVADLRRENPGMTLQEAIGITKRAPTGNMETLRKEALALSAAKADANFLTNPDLTLDKYRQKYGLGATAPAATPSPISPPAGAVTKEEYDALPPGSPYQHPSDPPGKMRIKGGASGTPAAPGDEEDNGA